jgi:hypothetical protein
VQLRPDFCTYGDPGARSWGDLPRQWGTDGAKMICRDSEMLMHEDHLLVQLGGEALGRLCFPPAIHSIWTLSENPTSSYILEQREYSRCGEWHIHLFHIISTNSAYLWTQYSWIM